MHHDGPATHRRRAAAQHGAALAAALVLVASLGACDRLRLDLGGGTDAGALDGAPPITDEPPLVVRELATGSDFTCALLDSGAVACWGSDVHGQLAIDHTIALPQRCGDRFCSTHPVTSDHIGQRVEIDAGDGFVCARDSSGGVSCWGSHRYGELGNVVAADGDRHFMPVQVALPDPAVQVAVGRHHACARSAGGLVRCWGLGEHGQLGRDATERCAIPEGAAAELGVPDTASSIACSATPELVAGLGPVDRVEAGDFHTCAIRAGGVLCWGRDDRGQLGDGEPGASRATPASIASTDPPLESIDRLALGGATALALRSRGGIAAWGEATHGALAFSPDDAVACMDGARCAPSPRVSDSPLTSIALGDRFGCGLEATGRALCWGLAREGRLGRAALPEHECVIGGVAEPCSITPSRVDRLPLGVRAIAVGQGHACALVFPIEEADASVLCWGRNDLGQLGVGHHGDPQIVPIEVLRTR